MNLTLDLHLFTTLVRITSVVQEDSFSMNSSIVSLTHGYEEGERGFGNDLLLSQQPYLHS